MEHENMNDYMSANHNRQPSASNHINPHLNSAAMAQNNVNVASQQSYPQSQGNLPVSYNDFFAGHTWVQPVHNQNAAEAFSRPPTASMANLPAFRAQPWEHQNSHHLNPPSHNSELNRSHSPMQQSNAYGPISGSSHMGQPVHDRMVYPEQLSQQQQASNFPITTSGNTIPAKAHHTLAAKPADASHVSQSNDQREPYVYVPYSKASQVPQQPTYGHVGQYPGYGIQYPQVSTTPRPSDIKTAQPTTVSVQPFRPPTLQQQVHQVLSNVPPSERLASNPRFTAIDAKKLCENTRSRLLTPLLAIGQDAIELSHSKVAQLPRFEARKNLLELRQTVSQDPELKLRIEKLDKKVRSKVASIVSPTVQHPSEVSVSKTASSSSSEAESSESSDNSDDELEIEEKIPIPASRPTDPFKGAEYDVIKTVWHPRSTYIENGVLLQRVAQFSDLFSKLRDRWKVSNDALKEAEQAKTTSQISSLTSKVNQNRKIVEVALRAAVLHGHPHILSMLSENKKLIAGMYGLLSDRINKKSYDDTLSVFALRFLNQMTNITTETLDSTKLLKALPYFVKRGSENVKALAKKIIDRAAENAKKDSKNGVTTKATTKQIAVNSNAKTSSLTQATTKSDIKSDANIASVETSAKSNLLKRPRVLEPLANQPVKRQATSAVATKDGPAPSSNVAKRPVTTVGSKSSASITPAKSKAAVKPSALTTAPAKKPVAAAARATPIVRPAETHKSSFSFGGMMQNILKPAVPETKEVSEEPIPAETEDEKARRLKKETRRKLRVSWKPDHDLCAIQYFTHDPDEETGHDASSVRDVTDVGNEGRMFKQLHKDHKEIVDVDLEEEEKEESFSSEDWASPTAIDFGDMADPEVEWNKIYVPFAKGELQPESAERELQKLREAATLMAVYITRDDIPSRPQSPSEALAETPEAATAFGIPDERTKQREQALIAPPTVDMDAIARILGSTNNASMPAAQATPAPVPPPPTQLNHQDLLAALQSLSQPLAPPAPQPAAIVEAPQTTMATTSMSDPNNLAMNPLALAGLLGNIPLPPQAQSQSSSSNQPPPIDFSALLSQFQNQSAQPPQQPIVPPPFPIPSAAPPIPNVADLWAQLGIAQPPPPPVPFGAFNINGSNVQQGQQPDSSQYNGQYEHPDRKRFREAGDDDTNSDSWAKRQNSGAGAGAGAGRVGSSKNWDPQRKPKWSYEDNSKKFTLPCKFWPLGKCTKGASCTYRHDM